MNLKVLYCRFANLRRDHRRDAHRCRDAAMVPSDSCRTDWMASRRSCPGILIYETEAEGEVYLAMDAGVLVKTGADVLVSVRRAIRGTDLGQLRDGGAGVSDPG
jgi:hypothetical protein